MYVLTFDAMFCSRFKQAQLSEWCSALAPPFSSALATFSGEGSDAIHNSRSVVNSKGRSEVHRHAILANLRCAVALSHAATATLRLAVVYSTTWTARLALSALREYGYYDSVHYCVIRAELVHVCKIRACMCTATVCSEVTIIMIIQKQNRLGILNSNSETHHCGRRNEVISY